MIWFGLIVAVGTAHVDFTREVRPLLAQHCFRCHGPDEMHREADLRLDQRDAAMRKRQRGDPAIVPGAPDASVLVQRITTSDPEQRMPPREANDTLTADEIDRLRRWVAEGADWPTHWSFERPTWPPIPPVANSSWCRNDLDPFVLARLEQAGLQPAAEAPKTSLIRRLSIDLTGLPPSPAEIDAFLGDASDAAYEHVVDRLLASPRYGERMAQDWLDLARYADTNGYHIDNHRDMWKWREWVIQAFNANQPFDRFSIEQLAGDLLPNATLAQKIATGFNRNHPITFEGGADPDEYQTKYVIDRVTATATTWLGLTMGCAECHDHKYDPLTQREFYQFYAFFNNVPEKGIDGQKHNPVPSIKVPSEAERLQLENDDRTIAALEQRLGNGDALMDRAQQQWESAKLAEIGAPVVWRTVTPTGALSSQGSTLNPLPDGSILASGRNPASDTYQVVMVPGKQRMTAFRLEALTDESLPNRSTGRAENGNFVLTDVSAQVELGSTPPRPLTIVAADADYAQSDGNFKIDNAIDQDPRSGWAAGGHQRREDREAVFVLAAPVDLDADAVLRVALKHESPFAGHGIGRFRLSLTDDDRLHQQLAPPQLGSWSTSTTYRAPSGKAAFDTEFDPERGDTTIAWVEQPTFLDGAVHALGSDENAAIYLRRVIEANSQRSLELHLGSDDAIKVWWNGALVHASETPRSAALDQDVVRVALAPGANQLQLKVVNYAGGCAFAFSASAKTGTELSRQLEAVLRRPPDARSPSQSTALRDHYRQHVSPLGMQLTAELAARRKQREQHFDAIPETMVMEELAEPRATQVLIRGNFQRKGDRVAAEVPSWLPPLPADARHDRLALARWLFAPEHPLTARVTVNRLWQQCFGQGLVRTAEDFGSRGELPSHPELLDWLALDLTRSGWDLKAMLKRMVMSATYRQDCAATREQLERDPDDRLLAHAPRVRLSAEMIRDGALAASGLLIEQIGGPSVKPYQPAGLWDAVSFSREFSSQYYEQDHGAALYRRSLYVYWKRSLPYPTLATFDAPIRETCVARRPLTNTPTQALVTLNDPVFVEAARALATRVLRDGGAETDARLVLAFRLCTSRAPTARECDVIRRTLQRESQRYTRDPEAARALLAVGESPLAPDQSVSELAAWTVVANLLLNLDETLHRG